MGYYDPPDDPPTPPQTEEVWGLLQNAGVDESVIETVAEIVTKLAEELAYAKDAKCSVCAKKAEEAQLQAEKEAEEYRNSLPPISLCRHNRDYTECNTCLAAEDQAYDAMRERR